MGTAVVLRPPEDSTVADNHRTDRHLTRGKPLLSNLDRQPDSSLRVHDPSQQHPTISTHRSVERYALVIPTSARAAADRVGRDVRELLKIDLYVVADDGTVDLV